jgi:protein SCO1/2
MISMLNISRRTFLQIAATGPIIHGHGQIKPPLPVPDVALIRHDGVSTNLLPLMRGHVTAVQLMFTECTTTCPIEGAIFERVQKIIPGMAARGMQLLSLSIDPEFDTPKALSAWRRRFHAGPGWVAAKPTGAGLKALNAFFGKSDSFGKSSDSGDHSTQVNIIDRNGGLVWRTSELPGADEIATILQRI